MGKSEEPATEAPTKCWCGGGISSRETVTVVYGDPVRSTQYRCTDSEYHNPTDDGRPEKVRVVYIAGPMSGYKDNNYPAFEDACEALVRAGYAVVNPASYGGGGSYTALLRKDLQLLLECDAVATLERWWESNGARNEVNVAGLLKMPVRTVEEWVGRAPLEFHGADETD